MDTNLSVIIPVYNEIATIEEIIRRVKNEFLVKEVIIVEMKANILLDALVINRKAVIPRLKKHNVQWVTNTMITRIADNRIRAVDLLSGKKISYQADNIVLSLGLAPVNDLYHKLKYKAQEVYMIGDCLKPRRVKEAIWEGSMIARKI